MRIAQLQRSQSNLESNSKYLKFARHLLSRDRCKDFKNLYCFTSDIGVVTITDIASLRFFFWLTLERRSLEEQFQTFRIPVPLQRGLLHFSNPLAFQAINNIAHQHLADWGWLAFHYSKPCRHSSSLVSTLLKLRKPTSTLLHLFPFRHWSSKSSGCP